MAMAWTVNMAWPRIWHELAVVEFGTVWPELLIEFGLMAWTSNLAWPCMAWTVSRTVCRTECGVWSKDKDKTWGTKTKTRIKICILVLEDPRGQKLFPRTTKLLYTVVWISIQFFITFCQQLGIDSVQALQLKFCLLHRLRLTYPRISDVKS